MGTIATMGIAIMGDVKGLKGALSDAESQIRGAAESMAKVGKTMTAGVTLPLLGIGAVAISASNDFNKAMANIGSLGVPTEHVIAFKDAIQEMSIETGQATSDIADGMYQVVSAFGDTADSVAILRTNVKLAKAGLATTSEAIALTSAVTKGYNDTSAEAVQHTADLAIQTVALGQTTLPELAGAIGTVTPLAGNMGVSMEDLFAVMATGAGVTGSASSVATQFRGILQSMMAPTASMTKLTQDLGYANTGAMLQSKGLQGTINAIVQSARNSSTPLQNFIGSIEGQTLALALAGPQADSFTKNLQSMQSVAGSADAAFQAQTTGVNSLGFAFEQVQAKANVWLQKLGDGLAPALGKVLDKASPLVDIAIDIADRFAKADEATQGWALAAGGLLLAMGPLLMVLPGIVAGLGVIGGLIGMISWPVALAILAIAGLALAWKNNFLGIQEKTAEAWAVIQPYLADIKKWIDDIPKNTQLVINAIVNLPSNVAAAVSAWWEKWKQGAGAALATWNPVVEGVRASWEASALSGLFTALQRQFNEPVMIFGSWVSTALSDLWDSAQDWFSSHSIMANVAFDTATTGTPGNYIDVPKPMPEQYIDPVTGEVKPRAFGGPVNAREPYIVGERGAELFIPSVSGRIVPNNELDGVGGIVNHFHITVASNLETEVFAHKVAQYMQRRG